MLVLMLRSFGQDMTHKIFKTIVDAITFVLYLPFLILWTVIVLMFRTMCGILAWTSRKD